MNYGKKYMINCLFFSILKELLLNYHQGEFPNRMKIYLEFNLVTW